MSYYTDVSTDVNRYEFSEVFGKKINGIDLYQTSYQLFLRNWMSLNTLNDSILLFHSVGTGKTCTAISIAEGYKEYLNDLGKKIIVMAPNETLKDNFIKQLFTKCTNQEYISDADSMKYFSRGRAGIGAVGDEMHKSLYNDTLAKIQKYYHFTTYDTFDYVNDNVNNSVLIIDEVHNVLGDAQGDARYTKLLRMLQSSYNFRLVLPSATPIVDRVEQIVRISNLLNSDNIDNIIQEGSDIFVDMDTSGDREYKDITEDGLNQLRRSLHGKISYVNENISDMPEKVYMGEYISELGIKAIELNMSNTQKKGYNTALSKSRATATLDSAALIIYPDGIVNFKDYEGDDDVFLQTNIREYSVKLYELLVNLKQATRNRELSFIYTGYVQNGVNLLKKVLEVNGFNNVKYITGSEGDKEFTEFNSNANKYGGKIPILVGTKTISEGITLKNVRHVHILEPHWNVTRIDQVIGRAVRKNSHKALNSDARNVKIYRYITRGSSYDIDYEKYKVSFMKDKINRKVYRLMKEISVDCVINKSNYNEYISNFTDGSRECDYQSCAYECVLAKKKIGKSELKSYRINIDFYDKFQLDAMKEKILNLFKIYFIWDLEYILAIIGAEYGSISRDAVYTALDKIVTDRITTVDMYNREGIIQVHGEYYIFKPSDKDYNDSFYARTLDFTVPGSMYFDVELASVKAPTQSVPKKGKAAKGTSRNPNRPEIYAFESDGVFRVVYNNDTGQSDSRRASTGKNIKFMKHKELVELLTKLDKKVLLKFLDEEEGSVEELLEVIDNKRVKKAALHDLIKNYMTEHSLIFDGYEKFEGVLEESESEEVATNEYDEDEIY